jgi:hypothetical protein
MIPHKSHLSQASVLVPGEIDVATNLGVEREDLYAQVRSQSAC